MEDYIFSFPFSLFHQTNDNDNKIYKQSAKIK